MALGADIPIAFLSECLSIGGDGCLLWLRRPREHFATANAYGTWNSRFAEKIAGTPSHGYQVIRLTFNGRKYKLYIHRVVFALAHGRWPADQIDHWNRARADNRIDNLREATNSLNVQNTGLRRDNTSGVKGVWWYARVGKWMAAIGVGGRMRHLGYFTSLEDAARCRLEAEVAFHPFRARVAG